MPFTDLKMSFMLDFLSTAGDQHDNLALTDKTATVATEQCLHTRQTIATSDTAINLGPIATPRLFAAINSDASNFIEIKDGSAGHVIAKLLAGEGCLIPLGSSMLAPYAKANTASVVLEYLLVAL